MLTAMKNDGAYSTASRDRDGNIVAPRKGNLGRLEWFFKRNENGEMTIHFIDYGNYGRQRWFAVAPTDITELEAMYKIFSAFMEGAIDSTQIPMLEVETASEETVEAEEVNEPEEDLDDQLSEVIASEDDLTSETEEVTA